METYTDQAELLFKDASGQPLARLTIHSGATNPDIRRRSIVSLPASVAESIAEEPVQLFEDSRYHFKLIRLSPIPVELASDGKVIVVNPSDSSTGWIDTRSQAGLLELIIHAPGDEIGLQSAAYLDIRPIKFDRTEYRSMLEDIARRSLSLMLNMGPQSQLRLQSSPSKNITELQQQFAFLRALINSQAFDRAINAVISSPHNKLKEIHSQEPINRSVRPSRTLARQLASGQPRVSVPTNNPIHSIISSLPLRIDSIKHRESYDTAENRFVKFALNSYRGFVSEIETIAKGQSGFNARWLAREASRIQKRLDDVLRSPLFKEVGISTFLPLGSPVLQARQGYRELLDIWLQFYGTASLTWAGGDDVFGSGKKGTDKLYEYWLFFQLVELLQTQFGMPSSDMKKLLNVSGKTIGISLKSGSALNFEWLLNEPGRRRLKMQFSYNRAFTYAPTRTDAGTWSRTMIPDFTLSWWPAAFTLEEAEAQEIIVHVHFDSKYRVESIQELFGEVEEDLQIIRADEKRNIYKRGDLHKMHAYKDAIKRTAGAYVLYPGKLRIASTIFRGYHEILPGVGAFPIRPNYDGNANGLHELKLFLQDITEHMRNRVSEREQIGYETYRIQYLSNGTHTTKTCSPTSSLPERLPSGIRVAPPIDNRILILIVYGENEFRWVQKNEILPVMVTNARGRTRISDPFTIQWAICVDKTGSPLTPLLKIQDGTVEFIKGVQLLAAGYGAVKDKEAIFALMRFSQAEQISSHVQTSALSTIMGRAVAISTSTVIVPIEEVLG